MSKLQKQPNHIKQRIWNLQNDPEKRRKHIAHSNKILNSKEAKEKRAKNATYYYDPAYRKKVSERVKKQHEMGMFQDPFKDDFEVIMKERPNDYAGVLTEDDYKEMA